MTNFLKSGVKTSATKALALTLAASFALTTALPVASAEAGHRDYRDYRGHHDRKVIVEKHIYHKKHSSKKRRSNNHDALAAGVIGFAIGAIIADQASRNRQPDVVYVQPQPRYVEPTPIYREQYREPYRETYREPYVERRPLHDTYREPKVIRYEDTFDASYEPWSAEWARWCDSKYRSFNINTGTYRGYDGKDHFCVVK